MKAEVVGELGICGVSAAIANAIYNATGVRVRDYPITLDKLIAGMPRTAAVGTVAAPAVSPARAARHRAPGG